MSRSSTNLTASILLATISFTALVKNGLAVGGIAEMKALTGDAPYMGTGNQEQAPEFFEDALVRQYYQNPAYRFNDWHGGSRFAHNYYRTPFVGRGGGDFGCRGGC